MTGELSWRAGDPVPQVAKVQMQITFADGRFAYFATERPSDVEIKADRQQNDRMLDKFFPAVPDVIDPLMVLPLGEVIGITLRMKARGAHLSEPAGQIFFTGSGR